MMSASLREMRRERWAAQTATEILPLSQRGTEGDLSVVAFALPLESTLAPLSKRWESLMRKFAAGFITWRPTHD